MIPKTDKTDNFEIPREIQAANTILTQEELQAYISKVNITLEAMQPGDRMVISDIARPGNRELFIEVVKHYMRSHSWQDGLSFSAGFLELRKYDMNFITSNKIKSSNLKTES